MHEDGAFETSVFIAMLVDAFQLVDASGRMHCHTIICEPENRPLIFCVADSRTEKNGP